jgi:hypothetical protein
VIVKTPGLLRFFTLNLVKSMVAEGDALGSASGVTCQTSDVEDRECGPTNECGPINAALNWGNTCKEDGTTLASSSNKVGRKDDCAGRWGRLDLRRASQHSFHAIR